MRRMFHDPDRPVMTPYLMWFDDDSYIDWPDSDWWSRPYQAMQEADMIGSIYTIPAQGDQPKAVAAQPWYRNKPLERGRDGKSRFRFATGGWWVVRTRIVQKWDWPWPELKHRGGDHTFGELIRQQSYTLKDFKEGVRINADKQGRESKAPKRGHDERPLWHNWRSDQSPSTGHQNFALNVFRPQSGILRQQIERSASDEAELEPSSGEQRIVRIPGLA
jgi:hypothetical protein